MLEKDGRATLSRLSDATGLSISRYNRACRNWNVVM
ncbi:MAG: winged helix-turn-helix transcriptional regulator [Bifidobacterium adolescentis]